MSTMLLLYALRYPQYQLAVLILRQKKFAIKTFDWWRTFEAPSTDGNDCTFTTTMKVPS